MKIKLFTLIIFALSGCGGSSGDTNATSNIDRIKEVTLSLTNLDTQKHELTYNLDYTADFNGNSLANYQLKLADAHSIIDTNSIQWKLEGYYEIEQEISEDQLSIDFIAQLGDYSWQGFYNNGRMKISVSFNTIEGERHEFRFDIITNSIVKSNSFDEEAIKLGFDNEDINLMCSSPGANNGNTWNTLLYSTWCIVEDGAVLVKTIAKEFNSNMSPPIFEGENSEDAEKNRPVVIESRSESTLSFDLTNNKISHNVKATTELSPHFDYLGFTCNDCSVIGKYGSGVDFIQKQGAFTNNYQAEINTVTQESYVEYDNSEFDYTTIWNIADNYGNSSLFDSDRFSLNTYSFLTKDINNDVTYQVGPAWLDNYTYGNASINRKLKVAIKNWQ